jgi:AraC-like DNA-binding protein
MSLSYPIPDYSRYHILPSGQVYQGKRQLSGCRAVDALRFKLINDRGTQDSRPLPWLLWVTFKLPLPTSGQKIYSRVGGYNCTVDDLSLVPRHTRLVVDLEEVKYLLSMGLNLKQVASRVGVSVTTLKRRING